MATHQAPDFPDDLAKSPKPFNFIPVDGRLRFSDETMTLDVLWARNTKGNYFAGCPVWSKRY
jgi:hypothetical protein